MKIIGIYKIISPSSKIYIGQSIDINKRFKDYIKYNKANQPKLKSSFKKHDVTNHLFEIIEECSIDLLNERERYWQEYYDVLGKNGLNCKLTNTTDKTGNLSQKTKDKIKNSLIGKKRNKEICEKLSKSKKGVLFTEQHKNNIKLGQLKRHSQNPEKSQNCYKHFRKIVYQFNNKKILTNEFISVREASRFTNIGSSMISACCNKKLNSAGGYFWSYTKDNNDFNYIKQDNKKIKIKQLNLNGELINIWDSVHEAFSKTKSSKSSIIKCCKKKQNTCNGFLWEYL